jgi:hypothetical protein
LTMTLMTTMTTTMRTRMTTMMTTTKTATLMMDNLANKIIMITWAALEAIQQKYHGVSQLHPLGD